MDEPACPGCRDLLQRIAALEAQVVELTRRLDDALRVGKRQAAPFRKGPPKPDPKTSGRKSGDGHGKHGHRPPPPEQIAECYEAHLPDACPHCRGRLVETGTADQFQTEIPRTPLIRKFRVHIGRCEACGKRTRGRYPVQTSDALGAAVSQIGPDAQAATAVLHTQMGLSHGKVASVFRTLFSIALTRGASARIDLRAATRLEPDYRLILGEVRGSEQVAADETGWRIGGHPAWPHAWVGDRATAYAIAPRRSADALERVIGRDWSGVLSHDGFVPYERFVGAIHQQCVAHVLRRARDLLATATRGAVRFPRQRIVRLTEAIRWRNGYVSGTWTDIRLGEHRARFDDRLLELVCRPRAVPEYATLASHLRDHFEQWFAFVFDPRIEPTNWKAEQAIQPAVVNRKVWSGNRTRAGARPERIDVRAGDVQASRASGPGVRQPDASRLWQSPAPASCSPHPSPIECPRQLSHHEPEGERVMTKQPRKRLPRTYYEALGWGGKRVDESRARQIVERVGLDAANDHGDTPLTVSPHSSE